MKRIVSSALTGAVLLMLIGCTGEAEVSTPTIDEIQREDGVPVETRIVEPASFRSYYTFTSSLRGAEESTASALIVEEVAAVLHEVGDFVERNTPVVTFPPDNPTLGYEQARVNLLSARASYERVRGLFQDQGVSQQAFDDARTQYDLARARWNNVQNITQVRAPISGFITRINVFESDNVRSGDPLFTVSDYTEILTTVWLTDRQARNVRVGRPARAIWQDHIVEGHVVRIDRAMDQERKAFATWLRFDNPGRLVNSGVTAIVEIETYRNDRAVILNRREVIDDEVIGTYVYLARDGRAVRVPIRIDRTQGLFVEVAEGITMGEEVITVGVDRVSDGVRIQVVEQEPLLVQQQDPQE